MQDEIVKKFYQHTAYEGRFCPLAPAFRGQEGPSPISPYAPVLLIAYNCWLINLRFSSGT